jgi:hypothetical protein
MLITNDNISKVIECAFNNTDLGGKTVERVVESAKNPRNFPSQAVNAELDPITFIITKSIEENRNATLLDVIRDMKYAIREIHEVCVNLNHLNTTQEHIETHGEESARKHYGNKEVDNVLTMLVRYDSTN